MKLQSLGFKLATFSAIIFAIVIALFVLVLNVFAQNSTNLQFVNHIQANLPEQDVFMQSPDKQNQVVRVEGDQAKEASISAKTVYAASSAVEHDPFKLGDNPLGPYPKGKSLGFTLTEWLGAQGGGTYMIDGESAQLDLNFQKLVPNGVYTVWCSRLTFPPNPAVVDRPCGVEDGSENVFKADAEGAGVFNLKMKPLEESTKETASLIALAYHSDGKTYGEKPGDFGLNSHVHIFAMIPVSEAAMSPAPSPTPQATSILGLSGTAWLIIIVVIFIIVLGWWMMSKKGSSQTPPPPTV